MAGAEFCICNTFSSRVICATSSAARFSAGSSGLRQATLPVCCPSKTAAKATNGTPQVRKAPLCIATTPFRSFPGLCRKCCGPLRTPASSKRGSKKLIVQPGRSRWSDFPRGHLVYAPDYRRNRAGNQAVAAERAETGIAGPLDFCFARCIYSLKLQRSLPGREEVSGKGQGNDDTKSVYRSLCGCISRSH